MIAGFKHRAWELVFGVLAVAGVLLALPLARPELEKVIHLPECLYIGLAILGTVLAAAALVSLTVLLLRRAFAPDAIWCELRPPCRVAMRRPFAI